MENFIKANQERWDQLTAEHEISPFYDLEGFKRGKDRLRSIELEELGDVAGKSLLHLQCHFGMDTMAWARRGAIATGVDFSPKAIALAKSLSEELGISAEFVCSDIANLPEVLSGKFDIVFTSYGVLHGLPDLTRWGEVIAHFLKPGGIFYIVEDHPFFRVFRPKPESEFRAERNYFFSEEPQRIELKGSYATDDKGPAGVQYVWDHSLGEIVNVLITAGLTIEFLHEFPYAARAKFPFMEQGEDGWWRLPPHQHGTIPFLFSLQARKSEKKKESENKDVYSLINHIREKIKLLAIHLGEEYGYDSLPLCVIDAVFSIGVRYTSTRNVVERFCEFAGISQNEDGRTSLEQPLSISDFIKMYHQHGVEGMTDIVYQNRQRTSTQSGILKSEAVLRFSEVLAHFGVENPEDVIKVRGNTAFEAEIKNIPGQKSGISLQYFYMLAGFEDEIKPDRMVKRFIQDATGKSFGTADMTTLLIAAADILAEDYPGLTPRLLDHAIWQYQRVQ